MGRGPLENKTVLMLVGNNIVRDARVQKEANSLVSSGAQVVIFPGDSNVCEEFKDSVSFDVVIPEEQHPPAVPRLSRFGREEVLLPLRALVNLTLTNYRAWRYRRELSQYEQRASHEQCKFTAFRQDMLDTARSYDFDAVHCHDLDMLYTGFLIAREQSAVLIYDSHELYLEIKSLSEEIRELFAEIEEYVFPHIDALITVSPQIGERLCEKYKRHDIDPVVLYNGGALVVESVSKVSYPVKLIFQGKFARNRNLLELVSAMPSLRGRATLTLQGWDGDEQALESLVDDLELNDMVRIVPPAPPLEVVTAAASHDVGVINSVPADENFMVTLPNKLFDYMCAGLAVASTDLPPIKEVIESAGCGITYAQQGVAHTAEELGKLVEDPQKIYKMKKMSLAAASQYAWQTQEKKLIALYVDLLKR